MVTAFNVRVGDKNPCSLLMRYPRVHLELTCPGNVVFNCTSVGSNIKVTQLTVDTGIAIKQLSEHIYTFHLVLHATATTALSCISQHGWRSDSLTSHWPLIYFTWVMQQILRSSLLFLPALCGSACVYMRSWRCEGVALHPGGKWSLPCVILLAVNHYRPYQWSAAGVFDWFVKMYTMIQTRTGKMFRCIFITIVVKNSC